MKHLFTILLFAVLAPLALGQSAALRVDAKGVVSSNIKLPSNKALVASAQLAGIATPGAAVYYNGSAWALSRANAAGTARVDAVVEAVVGNDVTLVYAGEITLSGLTPGAPYYLSAATAGATTTTAPTAAGTYRQPLWLALSATRAVVKLPSDLVSNNLIGEADVDPSIARSSDLTELAIALGTTFNSGIVSAMNQEVSDRNAAIAAAIAQEVTDRNAAIAGVQAGALPTGSILLWSTADLGNRPAGTLQCDGTLGTLNLTGPTGASYIVMGGGTVAAPTFSPVAGSYGSTQNVTISTATSGASIRYTTDGNDPTPTTGTVYSTPVSVAATSTLKAIAYRNLYTPSSVASAAYTISGGGGGGAYAYTVDPALATTAQNGGTTLRWDTITLTTGNVTKMGVKIAAAYGGSETVWIELYSGTTLVATAQVSASETGWVEQTITPVAVSAGSYNVAVVYNGTSVEIARTATDTHFYEGSSTYSTATAPHATLPTATGTNPGRLALGVFVE